MSIQRSPRVDRDTAEHLVAGDGVGAVAAVLRAAAAPAHQVELSGEDAVVAAFRAAAADAVATEPQRTSALPRAVTKALTVKAVIVLAVAGSTGIVLAASGGGLPVPWSDGFDPPASTTHAPGTPSGRTSEGGKPSEGRQSPATTDPAIVGLCDTYTTNVDKDLDNPAFRALVEAAGGKNEVAGYCAIVESTAPERPSTSAKPDDDRDDDRDQDDQGDEGDGGTDRRPEDPTSRTPDRERPSATGRPGETALPTEPKNSGTPSRTARTTPTEPVRSPTEDVTTTETPGSHALGAASAVPPSGAEPPSKGG
jgi:hypothetical protein